MILIADSGSTKTEWSLVVANGHHAEFYTAGINPYFQTEEEIHHIIFNNLYPQIVRDLWAGKLTHIYFYGAGCATEEKKEILKKVIAQTFKTSEIQVESDLLGAARGLLKREEGIACIMGTGSNSCQYNGEEIVKNVSPLGFILGDEGSGAALGKQLIADMLKKQLPENICQLFFETYQTNAAEILENVYKKPFPNRYLAQFSKFIADNIQEVSLQKLVYNSFNAFVQRNLLQYEINTQTKINFIGSIAYHFADILKSVLEDNKLNIGTIAQTPMKGLRDYHKIRR